MTVSVATYISVASLDSLYTGYMLMIQHCYTGGHKTNSE